MIIFDQYEIYLLLLYRVNNVDIKSKIMKYSKFPSKYDTKQLNLCQRSNDNRSRGTTWRLPLQWRTILGWGQFQVYGRM